MNDFVTREMIKTVSSIFLMFGSGLFGIGIGYLIGKIEERNEK